MSSPGSSQNLLGCTRVFGCSSRNCRAQSINSSSLSLDCVASFSTHGTSSGKS